MISPQRIPVHIIGLRTRKLIETVNYEILLFLYQEKHIGPT